jgi:adenine-specific DNA methylase
VPTKYFLWVKVQNCQACGKEFNLFPGYLLAEDERHPLNVLVCSFCGELNEVVDLHDIESCKKCNSHLEVAGPAKRTRCPCPYCNHLNVYPIAAEGVPRHRMFALEYFCPHCKPTHKGRFFKKPDADDLARFQEASRHFETVGASFVPEEDILPGDETDRLHRWGYRRYRDLFNARQLLSLELSCRIISAIPNQRAKRALATNLSDLLRYQNMLCRYDTMALKSLDIFSIHGFPVGLVQCESNFLGIKNGKGLNVGSGGWSNIIDKYAKAKEYCFHPFEILHRNSRKIRIPIIGEWIGERVQGVVESEKRSVRLLCQDAAKAELPAGSLDAVFTDPPYFGNVQYGELMDFCYVWLRRLMGGESEEGLKKAITRDPKELTGNVKMERGLEYFTEGLSQVFSKMAQALKPGAPLVFTYHHNRLEAYYAVGVAILDAGLACTAALPCPAEMGGSIHIYGTSSSIVDTIFVCRAPGYGINQGIFETPEELVVLVSKELNQLRAGGLNPSQGDIRCIISGHLTRMAVHKLRESWDSKRSTGKKLKQLAGHISELSLVDRVIEMVMDYGKNSEDIILRKRII